MVYSLREHHGQMVWKLRCFASFGYSASDVDHAAEWQTDAGR